MPKYDVVTFGSASQDIFLFSEAFLKKELCFQMGDKIEMDKIIVRSGGGGTNVATTFASQGLKTAYCGNLGKDCAGSLVLSDLKKFQISTEFLDFFNKGKTNHSFILTKKKEGRTILIHRGVSNYLPKNFNLKKMYADWFYLAPLGGKFAKKTEKIINFANKNKIKIAFNPGKEQIQFLKKGAKNLLLKIDFLSINKVEAEMLFGKINKWEKFFREIKPYLKGIISIGEEKQIVVFDGQNIYKAKNIPSKVIDMTGGGDASGAAFLSGLIKTGDIIKSIQLSRANAAACFREWGAKEGLLKKGEKYQKIKVKVSKFL